MDATDLSAKLVADQVDNYFAEIRRKERRHKELAKEHQDNIRNTRKTLFLLVLCVLAVCIAALPLVYLNLEVNSRLRSVSKLQSQVVALRNDNDAKERNYTIKYNYDELKDRAEALGMRNTTGDQIVYFKMVEDDYMEQKASIE